MARFSSSAVERSAVFQIELMIFDQWTEGRVNQSFTAMYLSLSSSSMAIQSVRGMEHQK